MKKWLSIVGIILLSVFFSYCESENEESGAVGDFTISDLQISPSRVPIVPEQPTFTITYKISYTGADGGPSKIRLTNASGLDITTEIQDNPDEPTGTISGSLEFSMVSEPATFDFQIWLIDMQGRESNKLSGTIQAVYDDTMTYWKRIPFSNDTWKMNRVLWVNDQFVSMGNAGVILTSTDGITWTKQNSEATKKLSGLVWSGSMFVAVGDYNTIITSPDGITWTLRNFSPTSYENLFSISWSGNRFVAVGRDSLNDKSLIFTSTDGITWTKTTFEMKGVELKNIAWSGTLFMAVGNYVYNPCCRTLQCTCPFVPVMITSPDGITWTDRSPVGASFSSMNDVLWDGSRFLIPANFYIVNTIDGRTWNYTDNAYVILRRINRKENKYAGVGLGAGYNLDLIYQSEDGIKWSHNGSPVEQLAIPPNTLTDIVWTGKRYVVSGPKGYMLVSPY